MSPVSLRAEPPAQAQASRPLIGLDLLRFGAAALVMVFHLACTEWLDPSSEAAALVGTPIPFPALLPLSSQGWIGVQMFFVISGYVIAYSASQASASRFLVNRVLRLMPGIWFCATLSFALALIFMPEPVTVLLAWYARTLVLFPVPRWIDGVYWTLGIEIIFYGLVFALLALRRFDRLESVVLAVGLASTVMWCLAAISVWPDLGRIISTRIAKLILVTHGCHFALGVLMWSGASRGFTRLRLLGIAACTVGGLLQIRYDAGFAGASLGLDRDPTTAWLLYAAFLGLFCLSIRTNVALTDALPALAAKVRHLGLATYPLYLLHTFIGALAMRLLHDLGLPPALCLAGGFATAVAAALLVSRRVEPLFRTRLKRMITPTEPGRPTRGSASGPIDDLAIPVPQRSS